MSTVPSGSRGRDMAVSRLGQERRRIVEVPVAGSNTSMSVDTRPSAVTPPTTSTRPSLSSVAV